MNKGLIKLKKINALARIIREREGFSTQKATTKQVYKVNRSKAVSIASGRLFDKNLPSSLDGLSELEKINKLATKIQKEGGKKTVKVPAKKVYHMDWRKAISKARKELEDKKLKVSYRKGKQLDLGLEGVWHYTGDLSGNNMKSVARELMPTAVKCFKTHRAGRVVYLFKNKKGEKTGEASVSRSKKKGWRIFVID